MKQLRPDMNNGSTMHFYTTEKISGRRSRTPEGFLLIEGVPLARTGMMLYGPDETPIPGGPDGLVYVERRDDEVFRTETVASANGKSVCNDHPPVDVAPDNWRDLTCGILMNPRRGAGIEDDFLVGDLLITTVDGIGLVESGKVELSMGYDAGYVQTGPGRGYQKDIVYNHVALVDKGRCGPRCSIGDREYIRENSMTRTTRVVDKRGLLARARDRLMSAVRSGRTIDEEMLEETLGDSEGEEVAEGRREPSFVIETHHHHGSAGDEEMKEDEKTEDRIRRIARDAMADALGSVLDAIDARFAAIDAKLGKRRARDESEEGEEKRSEKVTEDDEEDMTEDKMILGALKFEAPPGTNDSQRRAARDSALLVDSWQQTLALAEVLAPGIRAPTFDSKAPPARSLETICNLRRTALDHAYAQDVRVRQLVDSLAPSGYRTMDCGTIRPVFIGAAEFKKTINNQDVGRTTDFARVGGGVGGAPKGVTLATINKRNREKYGQSR